MVTALGHPDLRPPSTHEGRARDQRHPPTAREVLGDVHGVVAEPGLVDVHALVGDRLVGALALLRRERRDDQPVVAAGVDRAVAVGGEVRVRAGEDALTAVVGGEPVDDRAGSAVLPEVDPAVPVVVGDVVLERPRVVVARVGRPVEAGRGLRSTLDARGDAAPGDVAGPGAHQEPGEVELAVRAALDEVGYAALVDDVVRGDQVPAATVEAEVPPEGVVDEVVGDAVAERDAVGQVGGEGVARRVGDGDALDDRSLRPALVGMEVDRVAPEDLLVGLVPGAHVAQGDVGDLLRAGGHQHDHVRPALGCSADANVAGEVEDLGPVDDVGAHGDRRVREVERLIEVDAPAGDRGDDPPVVVQPVVFHGGRLGRRDDDLVADLPASGVVDGDRGVTRLGGAGEVGPRRLRLAVGVEHAVADDPEADVLLHGLVAVAATETVLVDTDELDLVDDRDLGRAQHEPAADHEVAGGHEVPAAGRVEDERPAPTDPHAADLGVDVEEDRPVDRGHVAGGRDAAVPGLRVTPARSRQAVGGDLVARLRGRDRGWWWPVVRRGSGRLGGRRGPVASLGAPVVRPPSVPAPVISTALISTALVRRPFVRRGLVRQEPRQPEPGRDPARAHEGDDLSPVIEALRRRPIGCRRPVCHRIQPPPHMSRSPLVRGRSTVPRLPAGVPSSSVRSSSPSHRSCWRAVQPSSTVSRW